jgi:hypothetical protein
MHAQRIEARFRKLLRLLEGVMSRLDDVEILLEDLDGRVTVVENVQDEGVTADVKIV